MFRLRERRTLPSLLLIAGLPLIPILVAAAPSDHVRGGINKNSPATIAGDSVVDTRALAELLRDGRVVLLDVAPAPRRPPGLAPGAPWLPVPHEDIPGSAWIPSAGTETIRPAMEAFLRAHVARLTGHDRDRPIVVYCHTDCALSWNAARRLIDAGYRHVSWYPGGVEAWRQAGLPTTPVKALTPERRE